MVYGRIAVNGGNPDISKGFAIALLIFNISLALLAFVGFIYILMKWSKYNDMKMAYMDFNTQNV